MPFIAIGKDQILFIKKETTLGTFVAPAAGDAVLVTGDGKFSQAKGLLKDEQKRMTISQLGQIGAPYEPGDFNFPCYIMPSGALGTAPRCGVILEAGFGIETIDAGVSVIYSLQGINDTIIGVSMVFRHGAITYFMAGGVINQLSFPVKADISQDAIGNMAVSGMFLRQYYAGRTLVNGIHALGVSAIVLDNAKVIKTSANGEVLVKFGTEDNGGAGYKVTAVNYTTDTITIDPVLVAGIADDDVCEGFIPTPTEAGTLVHGRYGQATMDDGGGVEDIIIASATINLNNNFKIVNDEKTNSDFPETIIRATNREVTLEDEKIFKDEDARFFHYSDQLTQIDVTIPIGDTAAYRYSFNLPKVEYDTPNLGGEEDVRMNKSAVGVASTTYNDELTLTFA